MKQIFFLFCLAVCSLTAFAQNVMRPVAELINKKEPGWPLVQEWISKAKNHVEVLPADPAEGEKALYKIQVTTRSPMGAVVYKTGGILERVRDLNWR
jgi:hypothetical protein